MEIQKYKVSNVKFSDLSGWLKAAIVIVWVSFGIGFIQGFLSALSGY
jgi:hypothetical protein